MSVNGTLVEDKMRRFKGECEHFRFNKSPIYTHDGASAKFSNNSQEMDNSVCSRFPVPKNASYIKFQLLNNVETCIIYERKIRLQLNCWNRVANNKS